MRVFIAALLSIILIVGCYTGDTISAIKYNKEYNLDGSKGEVFYFDPISILHAEDTSPLLSKNGKVCIYADKHLEKVLKEIPLKGSLVKYVESDIIKFKNEDGFTVLCLQSKLNNNSYITLLRSVKEKGNNSFRLNYRIIGEFTISENNLIAAFSESNQLALVCQSLDNTIVVIYNSKGEAQSFKKFDQETPIFCCPRALIKNVDFYGFDGKEIIYFGFQNNKIEILNRFSVSDSVHPIRPSFVPANYGVWDLVNSQILAYSKNRIHVFSMENNKLITSLQYNEYKGNFNNELFYIDNKLVFLRYIVEDDKQYIFNKELFSNKDIDLICTYNLSAKIEYCIGYWEEDKYFVIIYTPNYDKYANSLKLYKRLYGPFEEKVNAVIDGIELINLKESHSLLFYSDNHIYEINGEQYFDTSKSVTEEISANVMQ